MSGCDQFSLWRKLLGAEDASLFGLTSSKLGNSRVVTHFPEAAAPMAASSARPRWPHVSLGWCLAQLLV